MKNKIKHVSIVFVLVFGIILNIHTFAQTSQSWQIIIPTQLQKEEAVKVVLNDLQSLGKELNIEFNVKDDREFIKSSAILVGDASLNKVTAKLANNSVIILHGVNDKQGYEIITQKTNNGKIMIIVGSSVIGNVYGLYWLWDRMRVYKTIPDINVIRIPALKTRMSLAWGRNPFGGGSKERMQQALRQSINWVSGQAILDLVPWNSEPENSINAENRKKQTS